MRLAACRKNGRHGGAPFTCRACGTRACWECALRYWRERVLPTSDGGLDAQRLAIAEAARDGRLLGCCSDRCLQAVRKAAGGPFGAFGPTFKLAPPLTKEAQ